MGAGFKCRFAIPQLLISMLNSLAPVLNDAVAPLQLLLWGKKRAGVQNAEEMTEAPAKGVKVEQGIGGVEAGWFGVGWWRRGHGFRLEARERAGEVLRSEAVAGQ